MSGRDRAGRDVLPVEKITISLVRRRQFQESGHSPDIMDTNTMDSKLTVGHYDAFGLPVAHHSFALVDLPDRQLEFHCYGGIQGNNRQYPTEMWSPYIIGSKPMGKELPIQSYVARGLAEFGIPTDLERRVYNRTSGGYLNLGDASGMVYAVLGVCHQMCNVITQATRRDRFDHAAVNWPPSLPVSYVGWAFRGNAIFVDVSGKLAAALVGRAPLAGQADSSDATFLADLYAEHLEGIRQHLERGPSEAERQAELGALLGDEALTKQVGAQVFAADHEFQVSKRDLDNQLIRGEISNAEFAAAVNGNFEQLLRKYADMFDEPTYRRLFGADATGQPILVDPSLMPPSYEGVKEALGW